MILKRLFLVVVLGTFSFVLWSAGGGEKDLTPSLSKMAVLAEDDTTVTFREYDGTEVVLPKNPERAIVCLNSLLDLWYMSGGTAVARVKGSVNVPPEAKDLTNLGSFSKINMEVIMEQEPDFLIFSNSQKEQRDFFVAQGVPAVSINYTNYDDFRVVLDLFTRLTGNRDVYENELLVIQERVQSIIDQVPLKEGQEGPSIVILFASTRYVKVETENTVAGYNLKLLGARNIYKEDIIEGATRVDLSLEYILEQDPDIIFATTMGDLEKCKTRIEEDVKGSDIWGDLTAVKEDRYFILDKTYSIYKPNRFYPEAFKIEAEYLYPDTEFVLSEDQ
jgi:iron complex transport system substrate-binding protein